MMQTASEQALSVPVARLYGQPVASMPEDLFIPPDALAIFLETFEGPLDFLLYLIRRQHIDILDIPMALVTRQYLGYIDMLEASRFELAAEYLLMAAMLIDIKTRLLLPRPPAVDEDTEADPRAELVRRLLEYEQTKLQAQLIDNHDLAGRDFIDISAIFRGGDLPTVLPSVSLDDLADCWRQIIKRATMNRRHVVTKEPLSVRAYMVSILKKLSADMPITFMDLICPTASIASIVIHFLAILELVREQLVELVQAAPGGAIYLTLRAGIDA